MLKDARQVLIVFREPKLGRLVTLQKILQEHGGWMGGYVPDDAVLAVGPSEALSAVAALDGVSLVAAPANFTLS